MRFCFKKKKLEFKKLLGIKRLSADFFWEEKKEKGVLFSPLSSSQGSVSIIRYCKYHRRRPTPSSLFMQSLPPSHLSFTLLLLVNAQSPSRCHHLSDHHHVNTLPSWLPYSSSIDTTSPLSSITHNLTTTMLLPYPARLHHHLHRYAHTMMQSQNLHSGS